MKELNINGKTVKSIWLSDDETNIKHKSETDTRRRSLPYSDPTADIAIGIVMREEREKRRKMRKKQRLENQGS